MSERLTRKGARNLTKALDRVATAVQEKHAVLGIPQDVALDFAKRCDLISDATELTAASNFPLSAEPPKQASGESLLRQLLAEEGMDGEDEGDEEDEEGDSNGGSDSDDEGESDDEGAKKASPEFAQPATDETGESVTPGGLGWDPNATADDRGGPYLQEDDEPYMNGEFSQVEFHQLRDKQQAGQLAAVDGKLASIVEGDLGTLRQFAAALHEAAAITVSRLPGLSPEELQEQIDRIVAIRHEVEKLTAQYEEVLKKLKDLSDEEKAGLATLREAAKETKRKGQILAETEKALLQFTAYIQTSTPGIEQMIAEGEEYKGQRAGDFFGRIASQLGEGVSNAVREIYDATREDLTYETSAVRGLKIVEKTASFTPHEQRSAGIADVVVSLKEWLAGKADSVAQRILGFSGDITKWIKGFLERTKIVEKNADNLQRVLDSAKQDIDAALASSTRLASADNDWGFYLTR